MPAPFDTWPLVDDATVRLLTTAGQLTDDQCRAPSLLPGWSRGHLLTHIARNADALRGLLAGASSGREVPMYASPAARDADIHDGAWRPATELVADVDESADRLRDEAAALGETSAWNTVQQWRRGRRRPASDVPQSRLAEVELHHVDLGAGRTLTDTPDAVADALIEEALARLATVPDPVAFHVRVDGADEVRSGVSGGVRVSGTRVHLVGWLSGRADGSALRCDGELPRLPPWG